MRRRLRWWTRAWLAIVTSQAGPAWADVPPPTSRGTGFDDADRPVGMAELGVGWLTLPGAELCVSPVVGCSRGDTSPQLDVWQHFRIITEVSVGAGITLGLVPTTSAPRQDPPGVDRDHRRGYLTIEGMGRYYPYVAETFEAWVGAVGGLVVVSDTFTSTRGTTEVALVGPPGVTIRTEGYSLGAGAGVAFALTPNWSVGGGLRFGAWFLPREPALSPFGDAASLTGVNAIVSGGINVAFRSAL